MSLNYENTGRKCKNERGNSVTLNTEPVISAGRIIALILMNATIQNEPVMRCCFVGRSKEQCVIERQIERKDADTAWKGCEEYRILKQ